MHLHSCQRSAEFPRYLAYLAFVERVPRGIEAVVTEVMPDPTDLMEEE
jgi:hypothetical protein